MKNLLVVCLLLFGLCWNAAAQNQDGRGGGNFTGEVRVVDARRTVASSGRQWAVFIAIDEYREWDTLLYPVKDAREIKNILLEHYHINETRELYNANATKAAITQLFIELQDKTGPDDSVFVFHAGHGYNDERTKTSAWIPYNGGKDMVDQANWFSHLQIRSMLDSLKAKHVFLVSDSCFSGDLLDSSRGAADIVRDFPAAYDRVSRQAMSSGASEEVADASEFASRLKNTLLRTETPYLTPDYLLSQIKEMPTARRLTTIPILAVIPRSGHQLGGSFLFFFLDPKTVQPEPVQEPAVSGTLPVEKPEPELPPVVQGKPGEYEYFIGSWVATVEYNQSFDTYEINLLANGRCTVKITNDAAEQEASGNWDWNASQSILKINNAVFRNTPISYQRNIDWTSRVNFAGGRNSFNILAKPSANSSPVRFTFYRNN
jgi:hypothetical protein